MTEQRSNCGLQKEKSRFWLRTQTLKSEPSLEGYVGGHPVWPVHQSDMTYVQADEMKRAVLRVRLYDERKLKNKMLGQADIPIREIQTMTADGNQRLECWLVRPDVQATHALGL